MNYVFLSYYPIAKNIIFIAKDLINLPKNEFVLIHPTDFCSIDNKKLPEWVWTRGMGYKNNNSSWNHYFTSFPLNKPILNNFTTSLDALKYIFQLNTRVTDKILNKNLVKKLNPLTVHIRRGDSVSRNNTFSYRKYFLIGDYIIKIKKVLDKNNYDSLIVCTDSEEDFDLICKNFSDITILNASYNRSVYMRANESCYIDMEDHYYHNFLQIENVIDLSLIDLWYASNSSACIGTLTTQHASFYSRLIAALQKINNVNSITYDMFDGNYDPTFITQY